MSSLRLGSDILRNSLIDFMSQSKPFDGYVGPLNQRHYFAKNCNENVRCNILNRQSHEATARKRWADKLVLRNGQHKNHPEIMWCVGKLLSTTSLVIKDNKSTEIYWSVFRNNKAEARALEMLAQQNECWGDWTLSQPIVATINA